MNTKDYLSWLLGGPKPAEASTELKWAVLQATDTLVWAVRDGDTWHRTDQVQGSGVRALQADRVFEARLFGPEEQLLLWREGEGELRHSLLRATEGEWVEKTLNFVGAPHPLRDSAFTLRSDEAGRVTVVPHGKGVLTAHLLEEDPDTGLVRIVATRFVKILDNKE